MNNITFDECLQKIGTPGLIPPTFYEMKKAYVHLIISRYKGDKTAAAKVLGMDRKTIYRWL